MLPQMKCFTFESCNNLNVVILNMYDAQNVFKICLSFNFYSQITLNSKRLENENALFSKFVPIKYISFDI